MYLGSVATHLAKLRKHTQHDTFPTALHSIKEPKILLSRQILAAPESGGLMSTPRATSQTLLWGLVRLSAEETELSRIFSDIGFRKKNVSSAVFSARLTVTPEPSIPASRWKSI